MRKIFFISLTIALYSKGYCQPDGAMNSNKGLELFRLGDPIEKFKNQLTCDYNYLRKDIAILDSPLSCKGYSFLPADEHPVEVGSVIFKYAFLFPDWKRKIRSVVFSKSYIETDSLGIQINGEAEFNIIKKYLDAFLKLKGKDQSLPQADNKYSTQYRIVWYQGDACFELTYTSFKKRSPNQKVAGVLNMSLFNYRIVIEADPPLHSLAEYK